MVDILEKHMIRPIIVAACLVVALATPSPAEAGQRSPSSGGSALWCGDWDGGKQTFPQVPTGVRYHEATQWAAGPSSHDPDEVLAWMAEVSCRKGAGLTSFRQSWLDSYDVVTPKLQVDVLRAYARDRAEWLQEGEQECARFPEIAGASFEAVERRHLRHAMLCDADPKTGYRGAADAIRRFESFEMVRHFDHPTRQPSAVSRAVIARMCAGRRAVDMGFCHFDADRLDRTKYIQEVFAMRLKPVARARMLVHLDAVVTSVRRDREADDSKPQATTRRKRAQEAGKQWQALVAERGPLLTAAFDTETKLRAGQTDPAGCTAAREALLNDIQAAGAKDGDEVARVFRSSRSSLLAVVHHACLRIEGRITLAAALKPFLSRTTGPRRATWLAWNQGRKGHASWRPRTPEAKAVPVLGNIGDRATSYMDTYLSGTFTVKTIKRKGADATVIFKAGAIKEPVYRCRRTNRIERIHRDGRVEYEEDCVEVGTKTIHLDEDPIKTLSAEISWLKPKMKLQYARNGSFAVPLEAYDRKGRLVFSFGLRLPPAR